jgi:membrane dipeptidase
VKQLFAFYILTVMLAGCSFKPTGQDDVALKIHELVLTVDTHTDTPWELLQEGFDLNERHDYKETRTRLDFPRMKEGGLDAVFFAAFVGQGEWTAEAYGKAQGKCLQQIDSIHAHLARSSHSAGLAFSPREAYALEKEGKRTVFIGIENGYPVGEDLANLSLFYDRGARYITLCHSKNNHICDSSNDTTEHNGLSEFGVEVVREMNRLGIMVDVSHASDSSFYNVLKVSTVPVIASHSCARALCDNPRNLSDDMLRKLAENGGVVQMCILSDYVKTPEPNPERDNAFQAIRAKYGNYSDRTEEQQKQARKEWRTADSLYPRTLATVADAVDHIDHMVEVAGIDHVGIGTDFDGGGGLADCMDVSQLGNITIELVKRGYSEEEIRKIWGGNIMRVMQQVEDARDEIPEPSDNPS